MKWQDAGYGSEFIALVWTLSTLILQVVNIEEDGYNLMIEQKFPKGNPWRGELLLELKDVPFSGQTNPTCLLKVHARNKETCKEKLVREAEKTLKQWSKAIDSIAEGQKRCA